MYWNCLSRKNLEPRLHSAAFIRVRLALSSLSLLSSQCKSWGASFPLFADALKAPRSTTAALRPPPIQPRPSEPRSVSRCRLWSSKTSLTENTDISHASPIFEHSRRLVRTLLSCQIFPRAHAPRRPFAFATAIVGTGCSWNVY